MQTVGVFPHIFYLLFRRALLSCRWAIWWLTGYAKLYRNVYERSANVERIVWRSKVDVFSSIKPWHFVGVHERFVHPNFVLADDVVLCCLTLDVAVFVQLPSSVKNFAGDRCPFLWITLFENAVRTITMPLDSLIRLAETDERVSSFKIKSMLLSNAGRCGSTLLAKLIQLNCDRVLVLSEPDPLQCLQEFTNKFKAKYGEEGFLRVIRSAMLLSFKPIENVDAVVIKVRMTTMRVIDFVVRAAPEIKHLYTQRKDRLKTLQSWERAFGQALEAKILNFMCRLGIVKWYVKFSYNAASEPMRCVNAGIKHLKWTMFETMAVLWADNATAYNKAHKNHGIGCIYYEEVVANPLQALRSTLRLLDVCENGVEAKNGTSPTSLLGLKDDSQSGTPLSMKAIDNRRATPWTPELKERMNNFFKELDLEVIP